MRRAIIPVSPEGWPGAAGVERPVAPHFAGGDAGLLVPGDTWRRRAVVAVDPGAAPAGRLVAPGVGESAPGAPVGAGLAVGGQAVRAEVLDCIAEGRKEEEE